MSNPPVKISRNKIARLENSFNYHFIDWGKGVFDIGEKITEEWNKEAIVINYNTVK